MSSTVSPQAAPVVAAWTGALPVGAASPAVSWPAHLTQPIAMPARAVAAALPPGHAWGGTYVAVPPAAATSAGPNASQTGEGPGTSQGQGW